MTKRAPPTPPENRSNKGPGDDKTAPRVEGDKNQRGLENTHQQGQPGNSKQNTTHQGYQQDR